MKEKGSHSAELVVVLEAQGMVRESNRCTTTKRRREVRVDRAGKRVDIGMTGRGAFKVRQKDGAGGTLILFAIWSLHMQLPT
jgi:hypothetical protein